MNNSEMYIKAWNDWIEFKKSFQQNRNLSFEEIKKIYKGIDLDIAYTVLFNSLEIGISPMFKTINCLNSTDGEYYVSCHIIIRNSDGKIFDHLNYPVLEEIVSLKVK